jgi:hypothetical protein
MTLEFRDWYESKCDGKVLMRLQYVLDEHVLLTEVFKSYEERIKLLLECMEILYTQRENYKHNLTDSIRLHYEENDDEWASQVAGFYSIVENESVLESCSSPRKGKFVEQYYVDKVFSQTQPLEEDCFED